MSMSARAEAFAAYEAIREGRWDESLLQIERAIHERFESLGTSVREEYLRAFTDGERAGR